MKRLGTEVQYFGMTIWITLPFVTVDAEGDLYEHESDPETSPIRMPWWVNGGVCNQLGKVDLEGIDWKDTKREFEL